MVKCLSKYLNPARVFIFVKMLGLCQSHLITALPPQQILYSLSVSGQFAYEFGKYFINKISYICMNTHLFLLSTTTFSPIRPVVPSQYTRNDNDSTILNQLARVNNEI